MLCASSRCHDELVVNNVQVSEGAVVGFETERLTARKMSALDLDYLTNLHLDPQVMTTIGGVRSPSDTTSWLATNLDHWETFGFGQWMFDEDRVCVGRGGLRMIDDSVGENLVEVGYVFGQAHWGKGYATEVTLACLEIAVEHYGLNHLGAITLEGNDASTRVLEKCGFEFCRWVDHSSGPHKFLRWRLAAAP